jgi:hypothetical protein
VRKVKTKAKILRVKPESETIYRKVNGKYVPVSNNHTDNMNNYGHGFWLFHSKKGGFSNTLICGSDKAEEIRGTIMKMVAQKSIAEEVVKYILDRVNQASNSKSGYSLYDLADEIAKRIVDRNHPLIPDDDPNIFEEKP